MGTAIKHDAVSQLLTAQIESGLEKINEANAILLNEDSNGTPVRDIDKVLKTDSEKETSELPEAVATAFAKAQEAYKVYRENLETARNTYRTEILGEEAVVESEVDKEAVKEIRKAVMESLSFLKTYATSQGNAALVEYANSFSVPQVGRQGTSTVSGAKKPRVFVKIGDKVYGSFTEVALDLSTKENKITAGELAEAWNTETNGSEGDFKFGDHVLSVSFKPKKSDA